MPPTPPYRYDAFISYASEDQSWVRETLLPNLEAQRILYCIDYKEFLPGKAILHTIGEAIATSKKALLVLSPTYVAKNWTILEALMLQTKDPTHKGLKFLPILKETCEIPSHLEPFGYTNLVDPVDEAWEWQKLYTAIKQDPSSPQSTRSTPTVTPTHKDLTLRIPKLRAADPGQAERLQELGQGFDQQLTSEDRFNFLMQVLQATSDSGADPQVVYPILQNHVNWIDQGLLDLLNSWGSQILAELDLKKARSIAADIGHFSNLIQQFPLGSKDINMEIAILGYELILKVFPQESAASIWATVQNNLGTAYCNRIRGERAENLERGIEAYERALQVRTRDALPIEWAMTQHNLGLFYEITEQWQQAIASFQNAASVWTFASDPEQWITIQIRLARIYRDHIKGHYDQSIQALEQARSVLLETVSNLDQLSMVVFELAQLYHRIGKLDQARLYFKDALRLYQRLQREERITATLTALGNLEMQLGRIDQAQDHLQQALERYQIDQNEAQIAEVTKLLGFVEESQLMQARFSR